MTAHPIIPYARAKAATELRNAAALRRDLHQGRVPRQPAIRAIRACLRQARACIIAAQMVRRAA